jgi:hypothetical protein
MLPLSISFSFASSQSRPSRFLRTETPHSSLPCLSRTPLLVSSWCVRYVVTPHSRPSDHVVIHASLRRSHSVASATSEHRPARLQLLCVDMHARIPERQQFLYASRQSVLLRVSRSEPTGRSVTTNAARLRRHLRRVSIIRTQASFEFTTGRALSVGEDDKVQLQMLKAVHVFAIARDREVEGKEQGQGASAARQGGKKEVRGPEMVLHMLLTSQIDRVSSGLYT